MDPTPPHLRLAVRPHTKLPYCVVGEGEAEIGRYHATAREAEAAILKYCREQHRTATVSIFTPRGHLWRTDQVAVDGTTASVFIAQEHNPTANPPVPRTRAR